MRRVTFVTIIGVVLCGAVWGEEPVDFTDPGLKAAVEDALWISDPTPTDMLGLTSLDAGSRQIGSLTGLEYATNLETLNLHFNKVGDLSVLSGLTKLDTLHLGFNEIRDISPLASLDNLMILYLNQNYISNISALGCLTNLEILDIHHNEIRNVSPLASLSKVWKLALRENPLSDIGPLAAMDSLQDLSLLDTQVSDVSPLCSMTTLGNLDLRNCPLSDDSWNIYIPQIRANNPGVYIDLDSHAGRILTVTSSAGGSVIDPGEGEFTFKFDEIVRLEARADPGFLFVGWTGSSPMLSNPTSITMEQDYELRANFESVLDIIHVDDDAVSDPGPEDSTVSDPQEDGSAVHPFDRIQEAIDVAAKDVCVIIYPGTYRENIDLAGKDIQLLGATPEGPCGGPWPVIEGVRTGPPVVRCSTGEGPKCRMTGFVITQGKGDPAGAILCDGGSPTIAHCLIVGNRSTDPDGGIIYCRDSRAVLANCTIADNHAGQRGAGLISVDSVVTATNSIFWRNTPQEIFATNRDAQLITYNDVQGWWPDYGNLNYDPLFVQHGYWADPNDAGRMLEPTDERAVWIDGDYHLRSQAGRWDPKAQTWVQDRETSPCIDRGLRDTPVGPEPAPNGDRINMGVYSGMPEASKSYVGANP